MLSQLYPTMIEIAGLFGDVPHEGHLTGVEEAFADPRMMDLIGGVRPAAAAKAFLARERAHWREHHFGLWCFRDLESGKFAGFGGLRRADIAGERVVELVYALVPDHWGRGAATLLSRTSVQLGFENLGLSEIVALARLENTRSEGVMARAGLTFSGEVEHAGLPHVLYRIQAGSTVVEPRPEPL